MEWHLEAGDTALSARSVPGEGLRDVSECRFALENWKALLFETQQGAACRLSVESGG